MSSEKVEIKVRDGIIEIDGRVYNSIDEVPEEYRQHLLSSMSILADNNNDDIPDILQSGASGSTSYSNRNRAGQQGFLMKLLMNYTSALLKRAFAKQLADTSNPDKMSQDLPGTRHVHRKPDQAQSKGDRRGWIMLVIIIACAVGIYFNVN